MIVSQATHFASLNVVTLVCTTFASLERANNMLSRAIQATMDRFSNALFSATIVLVLEQDHQGYYPW